MLLYTSDVHFYVIHSQLISFFTFSDSGSSGGKGENLSMSSYGKVKRSDPSDDSQREPLYYPTPYATTQLSTYGDSPNTSHCNTLRRHDGKGHEYDIPHRHAQVNM